jgi:UDP-4-amino-4-deoxy-L-arabinose formyltransferase/UDP-glucuronic acid dehydrogenase (UDP-4-keto-hexauronic acid decarboxylating)
MSGGAVVFAYHTIGARVLAALLEQGERVAAVVTHPDDAAEGAWFASVADVARGHGLPVFTVTSPNTPPLVTALSALAPDIVLSVWFRRLLGAELLALPRVAALNLHGSLLPAYRGRAPLNWVLVNGERRTGVTLHHMTAEADAGDIVAQTPIDIDPDDTAATLYPRLVAAGVALVREWYPVVLDGRAPRIRQDPAHASVFGRRRPEDGRVAWDWPAARIANMVRAVTHPFPGAFVGDGPERLYLWTVRLDHAAATLGRSPGTVLDVRADTGVAVATGDGIVWLRRVQAAGETEEAADVWARRRGVRPGDSMALAIPEIAR